MQETQETRIWSLGREYPLETAMATHSSILAGEIPWTEDSGGLRCMEMQRAGHDWAAEHTHSLKACCGPSPATKAEKNGKGDKSHLPVWFPRKAAIFHVIRHLRNVLSLRPISVSILNGLWYCKGLVLYAIKKNWTRKEKRERMWFIRETRKNCLPLRGSLLQLWFCFMEFLWKCLK